MVTYLSVGAEVVVVDLIQDESHGPLGSGSFVARDDLANLERGGEVEGSKEVGEEEGKSEHHCDYFNLFSFCSYCCNYKRKPALGYTIERLLVRKSSASEYCIPRFLIR